MRRLAPVLAALVATGLSGAGVGCRRDDRPARIAATPLPAPSPTPLPSPPPFPSPPPERAAAVSAEPPGAGPGTATPSALVRALQQRLVERGFAPGYPDGVFGPLTREALREFQRTHGLPPDGVPDASTLRALWAEPARRPPAAAVRDPLAEPEAAFATPLSPLEAGLFAGILAGLAGAVALAALARLTPARRRRQRAAAS